MREKAMVMFTEDVKTYSMALLAIQQEDEDAKEDTENGRPPWQLCSAVAFL